MDLTQFIQHPLLSVVPKFIASLFIFYMVCKVIDFATGGLKVWKDPTQFKSRIMREGIIRWVGELLAIIFVISIDLLLGLNFFLTGFTLGLFVVKEGGSIDENLKAIGIDLPRIVFEKLNLLIKKDDAR